MRAVQALQNARDFRKGYVPELRQWHALSERYDRTRTWKSSPRLPAYGTLGLDIERIDRLARRHEQAVALDTAETEIGAALRQHDAADHLAVGRVDCEGLSQTSGVDGWSGMAVDFTLRFGGT